ncbi:MAG: hypothetical protein LAO51_06935 [Acidobacteriia bacterium]|nr:hypothetical protein [Terriglobia bacterium]
MLMKLLGFLRTYLIPVAVLVVLAVLALTLGPRVGLKKPWHIVVFAILLALAIAVDLVIWFLQRKRERQFETAIVQQAQQDMARASVARRGEMENLIARWKESIRLLREANLKGKNVLQKLPWFAVIGESGCGKTTLIKNSGLDFPIGDAKIRGIGGTKNCDWWFANEAIILDTAGRYAFEVQSAPDREEWERFLTLLKKTRKHSPVNGLVVTVPADSLLRKTEDEISTYAQHLRGKINDLMTRLEIVFPVYLVVTKVDLVEGFVGFFSRYPANRIREAVGRTFADVRPASCVETAGKTLDDLYDRLCSMSLGLMEEEDPGPPARPYLMHPEEFHTLAGRLKIFIESLFRENIYMRNPIFRGLYLTSGTQEGRTITTAFAQAAAGLGIDPDVLTTAFAAETPKRAYFVRDLLSRILVEDSRRDLVRSLALGAKQQFLRALYRVILPVGALALLFLVWALGSWAASRNDWRALASAIGDSRFMSRGSVRGRDVSEAMRDLSRIGELHASACGRSAFLNLGLVRSDPEYAQFAGTFDRAVEKHVLEPVLARIKQDLEGGQTTTRDFLDELSAYVAYRRALAIPSSVPTSRLEGLAGPSSGIDRLGTQAHRRDLASLTRTYAELGGKEAGGVGFQAVAQRIRQIISDLSSTDPLSQLRSVVREGAGAVRANASEGDISALWEKLRPIARGGSGGGDIPPELVEAIESDMESVPDSRPALEALRTLKPLVVTGTSSAQPEQAGGVYGTFVQLVRTPLKQATDVPLPQCGSISGDDPSTVAAVQTALQGFLAEVAKGADGARQGIASLNAQLSPSQQLDAQVTADLVRRGRMAEAYKACTTGWFDAEGPLSPKALSGGGGGGGGAGGAQLIGPSGAGIFKCNVPVPAGGGGGVDPATRAKLQALSSPLQKIWTVPDVPRDLIEAQKTRWAQIGGESEGGGGSARADWRRALSRIELDTPADSWQLEMIPSLIAGDGGTLKSIVSKIKNGLASAGEPSSDLEGFSPDAYMAALGKIGERLSKALESPQKGVELARLKQDRGLFDAAVAAAGRAPGSLQAVLKRVPQTILEKLGGGPGLGEFYDSQLRPKLAEAASKYPFKGSSDAEVDSADFDDLFAPQGKLAQLKDVVASPGGALKRLLDSAGRVQDAYGDTKAFVIKVTPAEPSFEVEPGIEKERLPLKFVSWGITLADTPVPNKSAARVQVRLQADATSKLDPIDFDIGQGEKRLGGILGRKKVYEKADLRLGDPPPSSSGPWSFLRFLQSGKPEKKGVGMFRCSWQVPLVEKKSGKKIATLTLAYDVATPVLEPGLFKGFEPPSSIGD